MTPQTRNPETLAPSARAMRFNRASRALAEAEALGVNLRDPFALGWALGPVTPEAEAEAEELDSLIYGRAFARFL